MALNPPSSGNINITSNGYWTKAHYTCLPGYKLSGSSERTCSNEGVWDSTDPQCGKCNAYKKRNIIKNDHIIPQTNTADQPIAPHIRDCVIGVFPDHTNLLSYWRQILNVGSVVVKTQKIA